MNEEHTITLKELGKIKTVKVYNQAYVDKQKKQIEELKKENAKLKETLTVGTTWNKGLISRNKFLEEESDKYRNMVFDKMEQIDNAVELLKKWVELFKPKGGNIQPTPIQVETEQFLKEVEK